ncbi:hypothetical protein SVIO_081690 [Streptomyces violaceusniger]|uniref:Uncharacterized protein n=1 Tax=Streptomyces violaceusniger TaxID=68280 RepID=A0A4D4LE89_STRVO|nr:hypothetical protein SVIO_081690 [Streptomyces violaceusniger]
MRTPRAVPAVHQRVQGRVGQAQADVPIPAGAQVLDGVIGGVLGGLAVQVLREAVRDDRVEQALFVAEEPVDGRRLHPGGGAHRPGRDRVGAAVGQQARGGRDDAVAVAVAVAVTVSVGLAARVLACVRCDDALPLHASNDNRILLATFRFR